MLNRSNMILAVLLLIQIALLGISAISTARPGAAPTEPLLAAFSIEAVDRMTIADNLDNEIVLARSEAGWALPDADDFPVNGAKAEELLGKIAALNTSRLIASNPSSQARLEVKDDDFQRKVSIAADSSTETVYLGGSGGGDAVYVRRGGDDNVYLGVGLNTWEAPPQVSAWINASYVSVPQDDILALSLNNAHGSFSFQHDGESWIYAGAGENETLDAAQMTNILRNAASIHMVEPLGLEARDEYGLDQPAVTVEVVYRQAVEIEPETADTDETAEAVDETQAEIEYAARSYTLAIGARQDDGNYALQSSSNDYVVLVRPSVMNVFANVSQDTLVKAVESESDANAE